MHVVAPDLAACQRIYDEHVGALPGGQRLTSTLVTKEIGWTVTLGPLEWTAASGPYVFGSDGPFGLGLRRHYVDRCVTAIYNAHAGLTTAHVTGTIDGVSVAGYGPGYLPWPGTGPADALGAIFDDRFTVRVVDVDVHVGG
jgi:hypothetical protein